MKNPVFTGAGVAIITPMYEDGSVNFDELGRIIEDQIARGTDAIVICGTTGECSTMTDEEQLAAIKFTVDTVNHRVPVIAGAGSNDTDHGCALAAKSAECGADALLLVTPYYNKTSQAGLIAHFTAMADAAGIPVILYNVPSRTGLNIAPETALELSKHPLINGIKEASGNISQVAKIAQLCGDELNIYSGPRRQGRHQRRLQRQAGADARLLQGLVRRRHPEGLPAAAGDPAAGRRPLLRGQPHPGQVRHERAGLERRCLPPASGGAQRRAQGEDRTGACRRRPPEITTEQRTNARWNVLPGIWPFRKIKERGKIK